jgi:hypothetical protein
MSATETTNGNDGVTKLHRIIQSDLIPLPDPALLF